MEKRYYDFQISSEELHCLKRLVADRADLAMLVRNQTVISGDRYTIRLDRADAEQLRGLLTERLATNGFKKGYSLTGQGEVIEALIDKFYKA